MIHSVFLTFFLSILAGRGQVAVGDLDVVEDDVIGGDLVLGVEDLIGGPPVQNKRTIFIICQSGNLRLFHSRSRENQEPNQDTHSEKPCTAFFAARFNLSPHPTIILQFQEIQPTGSKSRLNILRHHHHPLQPQYHQRFSSSKACCTQPSRIARLSQLRVTKAIPGRDAARLAQCGPTKPGWDRRNHEPCSFAEIMSS